MILEHGTPSQAEQSPNVEYATQSYEDLVREIDRGLISNHSISYVPFKPEQKLSDTQKLDYKEAAELPDIMAKTDAIICISRDEDPNPDYTDQYPEYNIVLTPSGEANVAKSVELFKLAREAGNTEVKFIATGRMHNRAIRMMLALPVLAEFMNMNGEDVYHISEDIFRKRLNDAFTPENIANLMPEVEAGDDMVESSYKQLTKIFEDPEYGVAVPTPDSTQEELQAAADAIYREYKKYPRISTSRLMVERAVELGVPLENIFEEDGSVDTITNFVNTAEMLQQDETVSGIDMRRVVIVAGSDHLPRTTWIADHILPDDDTLEIVCVESDPSLTLEAYDASCERERNSFLKGSKWIGITRNLKELEAIVEAGYFSKDRVDTAELARRVAAEALQNTSHQ